MLYVTTYERTFYDDSMTRCDAIQGSPSGNVVTPLKLSLNRLDTVYGGARLRRRSVRKYSIGQVSTKTHATIPEHPCSRGSIGTRPAYRFESGARNNSTHTLNAMLSRGWRGLGARGAAGSRRRWLHAHEHESLIFQTMRYPRLLARQSSNWSNRHDEP